MQEAVCLFPIPQVLFQRVWGEMLAELVTDTGDLTVR